LISTHKIEKEKKSLWSYGIVEVISKILSYTA